MKNIVLEFSGTPHGNLHQEDNISSLRNPPKSRPKDRFELDTGVKGYMEESDSICVYVVIYTLATNFKQLQTHPQTRKHTD